jgi:hypothetical protein
MIRNHLFNNRLPRYLLSYSEGQPPVVFVLFMLHLLACNINFSLFQCVAAYASCRTVVLHFNLARQPKEAKPDYYAQVIYIAAFFIV